MESQEVEMVEPVHPPEERLRALVENLSAYIEHFHGGSVDLVSYQGNVVKVRLGGACLGCPLSPVTLHGWVEGTIKQFFPDAIIESAAEGE
jgi:Fe-S cluster biogenesis protein NfuA